MKKKLFVAAAALILLSLPAFADFRLDIGLDAPLSVGVSNGASGVGSDIGQIPFLPIPEVGLYYFWGLGPVDLGVGLRAYTIIIESLAWPNLVGEVNLGPVVIQAQLGGGFFAAFGAAGNSTAWGQVVVPDLSAWFKLGKSSQFRLGGGIMGIYAPSALGSYMPWLVYLGGKVALNL
ncbi:MAG: hypothetical protein ABSG63_11675 [Spirochaetia bacterium]|jgi:hypothetical protein